MRPDRDMGVDEAVVLHKGRLSFRQLIETKRSRFGVKVFVYVLLKKSGMDIVRTTKFIMEKVISSLMILLRQIRQLMRILWSISCRIYLTKDVTL